ncbi:hypothetical protein [Streptomyces sp. NPDC093984]
MHPPAHTCARHRLAARLLIGVYPVLHPASYLIGRAQQADNDTTP